MEKYQTILRRFLAGLLDMLLFMPLILIGVGLEMTAVPMMLMLCWQPIEKLYGSAYYIFFHHRFGQSVGKMACRVKVVDHRNENPISFSQAFMRNSIDFVISIIEMFGVMILLIQGNAVGSPKIEWFTNVMVVFLIIYGLADIVVALINPQRRAIHDLIAGTVVVRMEDVAIKK